MHPFLIFNQKQMKFWVENVEKNVEIFWPEVIIF